MIPRPLVDAVGWYINEHGDLTGPTFTTIERCKPLLSEIVAALFERGGLTADQYDVSQLTDEVDGYRVASEGGIDAFLSPLMIAFRFDVYESGGKILCVKRGGEPVMALTVDDLAEREGDAVGWERVQEAELLRRVTVAYVDPATSYTTTTQKWERRSGTITARGEASVEIPITADADTAARIAEMRGKIAWSETEKVMFNLPVKFSRLTPTDVVTLTDADENDHRIRVMQVEEDSGVLLVEGTRERQSAYTSTASGVSGPLPTVPNTSLIGPTVLHAMNLPRLRTQDNQPGAYIAVTGLTSGWKGADLYVSVDGGVSEQFALRCLARATMGELADACTDSSEPITVTPYDNRVLYAATEAQLDARLNAFAIDSGGTCEVAQFGTPTADGSNYDLTDTRRGLLDTTAAAHAAGDAFTLLDGAVYFLPLDISLAGRTLILRAVSIGTSPDANETTEFVFLPQFTGPEVIEYLLDETGAQLLDETGGFIMED